MDSPVRRTRFDDFIAFGYCVLGWATHALTTGHVEPKLRATVVALDVALVVWPVVLMVQAARRPAGHWGDSIPSVVIPAAAFIVGFGARWKMGDY